MQKGMLSQNREQNLEHNPHLCHPGLQGFSVAVLCQDVSSLLHGGSSPYSRWLFPSWVASPWCTAVSGTKGNWRKQAENAGLTAQLCSYRVYESLELCCPLLA